MQRIPQCLYLRSRFCKGRGARKPRSAFGQRKSHERSHDACHTEKPGNDGRLRVSNDNPFSEALFKTLKCFPGYPTRPFDSLEAARVWVRDFVQWYNNEHLHSVISFVTPAQRHTEADRRILEKRNAVYKKAQAEHPERWAGNTRNWSRIEAVYLNPNKDYAATEAA